LAVDVLVVHQLEKNRSDSNDMVSLCRNWHSVNSAIPLYFEFYNYIVIITVIGVNGP